MSQAGAGAGDERLPPLSKELDSVPVRYTWNFGDPALSPLSAGEAGPPGPPEQEVALLRGQVRHFTLALEDIVTLALSNADYKERAIMMHRRAVAALSSFAPTPDPPRRG